jgi:hypothetical protein
MPPFMQPEPLDERTPASVFLAVSVRFSLPLTAGRASAQRSAARTASRHGFEEQRRLLSPPIPKRLEQRRSASSMHMTRWPAWDFGAIGLRLDPAALTWMTPRRSRRLGAPGSAASQSGENAVHTPRSARRASRATCRVCGRRRTLARPAVGSLEVDRRVRRDEAVTRALR